VLRRALVFAALLICISAFAFARPGGGQNYQGGGSSGGSSGGSRSGSTYSGGSGGSGSHPYGGTQPVYTNGPTYHSPGPSSSNPLGFLCGMFILAGVILVVVLVVSAANRLASKVRSAVLDAQYDQQARSRRSVSLEAIQARDPNLTEESITGRVRQMSDMLRDAWMAGDMRQARAFMSDGCFSRFQVQLELMRTEGVRNVMSDTRVMYMTLEAVQSSPPLDIVHVRFTAEGRDVTVPVNATPDQIKHALSKTQVQPYTEIWSLVRRQGAQTKLDPTSVGKACPSCGAPFPPGGGEVVSCQHCKATVCSGEHDWVLAEITQLSEWHPNSADEVPGLAQLQEIDLGVTRETLEDRASYLFWKWIESGRKKSAAPLRKAARPELVARGGDGAAVAEQARDIAVGGADVVLCDVAQAESGEKDDHVYVNVYWSARFAPGAEPFPRQSTLRLARKTGVSTKLSMTQVICPNCGGPLAETDDPRCGHCGVEVVATGMVWALDAVGAPGSGQARHPVGMATSVTYLVPDIRDPRERMVLFSQMAHMMASGGLNRAEKKLLVECGKRWGIPEDVVGRALQGQLVGSVGPVASPEWFLAGLVAAALIDGTIDPQEQQTLERMCASLNLSPQMLQQQTEATRQRMAAQQASV
jgi:Tim44-like domain